MLWVALNLEIVQEALEKELLGRLLLAGHIIYFNLKST